MNYIGWVQLSNTGRHLTWGINEFWKSCQEFYSSIYMQQQTRILSSLWAFITPPSVCLETQIRGQKNLKKSNLRIVPKTWQWLSWRVVWHEGEKLVLIKPHNRVWKPIYSTASFPEAATATKRAMDLTSPGAEPGWTAGSGSGVKKSVIQKGGSP